MDPSLRTAATGMMAQQTRVEVISNNLANVNTTGFQRSRARFEDLLYQTRRPAAPADAAGGDAEAPVQIGRGTRLAAVHRIESQGALQETGRPLDLAIEGDGLFQVRLPDGTEAYTRDGSLSLTERGALVTQSGYEVVPDVLVPDDATGITVDRSGTISVAVPGDVEPFEVGRLELVRFPNGGGLEAVGENLFVRTAAAGEPLRGYAQEDGFGRVVQGSLEGSNVEIVQEMVEMITALRAYEINSKSVQTSEQLSEIANQLVR